MRETKFRIRDTKTNTWIWGPGHEINLFGEVILLAGGVLKDVSIERLNDIEALQFTGQYDQLNREIYEGDIIKFMGEWDGKGKPVPPQYKLHEVVFTMGRFVAILPEESYKSFNRHDKGVGHTDSEVVGNIVDNPDLLRAGVV